MKENQKNFKFRMTGFRIWALYFGLRWIAHNMYGEENKIPFWIMGSPFSLPGPSCLSSVLFPRKCMETNNGIRIFNLIILALGTQEIENTRAIWLNGKFSLHGKRKETVYEQMKFEILLSFFSYVFLSNQIKGYESLFLL